MQKKEPRIFFLVWLFLLGLVGGWVYKQLPQFHVWIYIALGVLLLCVWGASLFFLQPKKRLASLLWQLVFFGVPCFFVWMGIPIGYIILGALLLGVGWYILAYLAVRRFVSKLNRAAQIYQQDRDGNRYLAELYNSRHGWGWT